MHLTTLAQFTTRSYRALLADVESGALPAKRCGANSWLVHDDDFETYLAKVEQRPLFLSAFAARVPAATAEYLWSCLPESDATAVIRWKQELLEVGLALRDGATDELRDRACDLWAAMPRSVGQMARDLVACVEAMREG